jgi:hypothetical protein
MRLLALFAVLIVSPLLAAPAPRDVKKTASIDGTWEVEERHINGIRDDSMPVIRWTIKEESLVIEMRGKRGFGQVEGSTYRLLKPAGGQANEIDYVHTPSDGDLPASTFWGRFERDGDTLRICISGSPEQDRPADCKPSSGTNLYVFKRVRDKLSGAPKR